MASMQEQNPKDSPQRDFGQGGAKKEDEKEMSLEEISQYRAMAQQNSMDAIRAAEERYARAKESAATALKETKDSVGEGLGAAVAYAAAKGAEAKEFAVEKSQQGYEAAKEYAQQTAAMAAEKAAAAKDVVAEKGRRGVEMAVEQGSKAYEAAKDVTVSTGKTTAEYVRDKAMDAKEAAVGAVQTREETRGGEEKEKTAEISGEEIQGEEPLRMVAKERLAPEKEHAREEVDRELGYLGIEGKTTAMEDVYEAVGKTVIGIAEFIRDLVIGGEAKPGEEKK